MNSNHSSFDKLISLLNTLPDRVFILSESGVFLDVFGGVDTNAPFDVYKLIGVSLHDVLNDGSVDDYLKVINKALYSGQTQQHIYSSTPVEFPYPADALIQTKKQWYEGRVHPLEELYQGERAVVWVSRNITASYEQKQKLVELSEHDELTTLYNRRAFFSKAKECHHCFNRYGAISSVLMIDIDHFKRINDSKGHLFGDEVIREVAKILKAEAREADTVGRLGGEEFSIILKMTDIDGAVKFAERIRKTIEAHKFDFDGSTISLTISVGIAQLDTADNEHKQVFKRADDALYQAKAEGRNRVVAISE